MVPQRIFIAGKIQDAALSFQDHGKCLLGFRRYNHVDLLPSSAMSNA
jgi:hypothetical protein